MESRDDLSIREYEFKGVKILLKLDRRKGIASFVDYNNGDYKNKKWIFADRELEFMDGWLNIVEAMKEATLVAKEELNKWADEDEKAMIALQIALQEDNKGGK